MIQRRHSQSNLIPVDILPKTGPRDGKLSRLATWCISIGQNVEGMEGDEARLLEDRIADFVDRCFFQRDLWYCMLPATTSSAEATDAFVATNTSSVKIMRFDIEVAKARGRHNEDLRTEIQDAYDRSDMLRYYFSDDAEDYIPDIGEWMLKVACLHVNEPPKESNYSKAVNYLLGSSGSKITSEPTGVGWRVCSGIWIGRSGVPKGSVLRPTQWCRADQCCMCCRPSDRRWSRSRSPPD